MGIRDKIRNGISEYLYGTKRQDVLKRRERFYRAYAPEKDRVFLEEVKATRFNDIFIGKALPTLIDLASLGAYLFISREPVLIYGVGIGFAEFLRFGMSKDSNEGKADFSFRKKSILNPEEKTTYYSDFMKRLMRRDIDEEGEEWKRRYFE